MRNMIFIALALAAANLHAITATKAYVDGATNATLAAAKSYTDASVASITGVNPSTVTNIASAVVSNEVPSWARNPTPPTSGLDTNAVNQLIGIATNAMEAAGTNKQIIRGENMGMYWFINVHQAEKAAEASTAASATSASTAQTANEATYATTAGSAENASYATVAGEAYFASEDAAGNNIINTYATKDELAESIASISSSTNLNHLAEAYGPPYTFSDQGDWSIVYNGSNYQFNTNGVPAFGAYATPTGGVRVTDDNIASLPVLYGATCNATATLGAGYYFTNQPAKVMQKVNYHNQSVLWDKTLAVQWKVVMDNGILYTIAVTNTPPDSVIVEE